MEDGPPYLEYICQKYNIKDCFVVEDSISSIIGLHKCLSKIGVNLHFGLRLNFVSDLSLNNDTLHKNILFATGDSYKALVKLSTLVHTDFVYESVPRIDYNKLLELWHEDFALAIPFYDSFIFNNLLTVNHCVPNFGGLKPIVFLEDNGLPFDYLLRDASVEYATINGLDIWETKTILYENRSDFLPWMVRKLMERKSYGSGNTIKAPNLEHCGSDSFCLEAFFERK